MAVVKDLLSMVGSVYQRLIPSRPNAKLRWNKFFGESKGDPMLREPLIIREVLGVGKNVHRAFG